jgi:hypothetical protein
VEGTPTLSRCLARWDDRDLVSGGRHHAEVEFPRGAVVVVVGPVGPGVEHDWQALAGMGTGDELRPARSVEAGAHAEGRLALFDARADR